MPVHITPEFWRAKPVFVTGASGLLGGWTVRRLLELGARVVALVRDGVPGSMLTRDDMISQVTVVRGSLEDAGLMLRACTEYEVDTVLHLAAQPIVGVAKMDPAGTFRANIAGTWNVLEAARQAKVKQTVIASSDKAYGDSPNLPYTEDQPLQGRYPYDCSKSCADLIAHAYLTTYDMPVSVVRCANLFGGGDLNFNRAIPGVIQATLAGQPFVIRSDGKFVRDFLYVEDAADAYLHLAEALDNGSPQGAYNFSLEVKITVLKVVQKVLAMLNRPDLAPVILNQASAEIREQYMSCDKARAVLKWSPAYSLDEGLRKTIAWYSNYLPTTAKTSAAG
jgi:CDP-glucose 4,6-dehydratase